MSFILHRKLLMRLFLHTFAYHTIWYGRNGCMKKIEKKQWLVAGLRIVADEGVAKITIDNLCSRLKITKGAFYHHFRNIDGYIDALMSFWVEESTLRFIDTVDRLDGSEEKLYALSRMSASSEYKCEGRIRGWSYTNDIVRRYVVRVDRLRLDYLEKLFLDRGCDAGCAHKVAVVHYGLLVGLQHICPEIPADDFNELQNMLIGKF